MNQKTDPQTEDKQTKAVTDDGNVGILYPSEAIAEEDGDKVDLHDLYFADYPYAD